MGREALDYVGPGFGVTTQNFRHELELAKWAVFRRGFRWFAGIRLRANYCIKFGHRCHEIKAPTQVTVLNGEPLQSASTHHEQRREKKKTAFRPIDSIRDTVPSSHPRYTHNLRYDEV
jgi:hypothetical protein